MIDTDTNLKKLNQELESLERSFELLGGRSIELAEQIDAHRAAIALKRKRRRKDQ